MTAEILNEEVGQVNYNPNNAKYLGVEGSVEDSERGSNGSQMRKLNSGMLIKVRRVRFGGAYAPGSRVKFTSGYVGTRVEQAGAEVANGIVDPFLSANTASGDVGLIFIEGPMDVISSAAISANAAVEGAASGKVVTLSSGTAEGRMIEAASGADENKRAYMNFSRY